MDLVIGAILWEQPLLLAAVILALGGASVLVVKRGARHRLSWPAILVVSSLLVMTVALLTPPGSLICFAYIVMVFAVSLALFVRNLVPGGRTHHDENTGVPVISANLDNPVLVVQGQAQLLQGGGVVFDTRLDQQIPEELIGGAAPGAQHFE
ncbi:MAG TPA: hypothetical protein VKF37_03970 [Chloroflexota bacterium]|nr:hypothetical protein [Chloroflexota bacterium]